MSGLWISDIFSFADSIRFSREQQILCSRVWRGNKVAINQGLGTGRPFQSRLETGSSCILPVQLKDKDKDEDKDKKAGLGQVYTCIRIDDISSFLKNDKTCVA